MASDELIQRGQKSGGHSCRAELFSAIFSTKRNQFDA